VASYSAQSEQGQNEHDDDDESDEIDDTVHVKPQRAIELVFPQAAIVKKVPLTLVAWDANLRPFCCDAAA
jgi:hypothetical protein